MTDQHMAFARYVHLLASLQGAALPVYRPRPNLRTPEEVKQAAKAMREQGMTFRDIGARLGVSHGAVQQWLNPELRRPYVARQQVAA
jgi:AcrR family transcriptional regulator